MNKKLQTGIILTVIIITILTIWVLLPEKEILQGEAEAKTVNVSSKIPGRVQKIYVEKGQYVTKGQLLAETDTPELEAKKLQIQAKLDAASAIKQKTFNGSRLETVNAAKNKMLEAQAGYDLASKTNKRLQNLYKEGVISAQKADEAKAKLEASKNLYFAAKSSYELAVNGSRVEDKYIAEASVNQAEGAVQEISSYLKESKLISPINGEISEISAEEGELIGTGYPIFVINDSENMWASFNIREDMLKDLKQGNTVYADIPALGLKKVPMTITLIAVRGNYATYKATRARGEYDLKTFEVRAVPQNKLDGLKPGMSIIMQMSGNGKF